MSNPISESEKSAFRLVIHLDQHLQPLSAGWIEYNVVTGDEWSTGTISVGPFDTLTEVTDQLLRTLAPIMRLW